MIRRRPLLALFAAFAWLGPLCAARAQEVRLGTDTRARKFDFESVAGRRVEMADGKVFSFRRDGSFRFEGRRGRRHEGRWAVAFGNALDLTYDDGDTEQVYFITIEGKLYFRRAGHHRRRGADEERNRVVDIAPLR